MADPFACFGGGDGSSSSDDDNNNDLTDDMEEAYRLRDKSNSKQSAAITDMLEKHQSVTDRM